MVSMNRILNNFATSFPLVAQIFRFITVGATAAAIHLSIVMVLVEYWSLLPLSANIFAFFISFQVSYWGHRFWTFKESGAYHHIALPKLLLIQIINFAANESLFYLFLQIHLSYPVALILVLAILPAFTFTTSKLWVFR